MMEIQQHDGVVVDVAVLRQGFAELLREREREVLQGRREAPKAVVCCSPSPPLYIGPLGRGAAKTHLGLGGAAAKGWGACPPSKGGAPPLGFPPQP